MLIVACFEMTSGESALRVDRSRGASMVDSRDGGGGTVTEEELMRRTTSWNIQML